MLGMNRDVLHPTGMTSQCPLFLAGLHVPEARGAIVTRSSDERIVPDRQESDVPSCRRVAGHREQDFAALHIPQLRRSIFAAGGDTACPSALNATAATAPACPSNVRIEFPVVASQTLAVRSPLPVAMRRPSGLKAIAVYFASCPFNRMSSRPEAVSSNTTTPFSMPTATALLSGVKLTAVTGYSKSDKSRAVASGLFADRRFADLPDAVASRLPPGSNASTETFSVWPLNLASSLPFNASQMTTNDSLALAIRSASGLKREAFFGKNSVLQRLQPPFRLFRYPTVLRCGLHCRWRAARRQR